MAIKRPKIYSLGVKIGKFKRLVGKKVNHKIKFCTQDLPISTEVPRSLQTAYFSCLVVNAGTTGTHSALVCSGIETKSVESYLACFL